MKKTREELNRIHKEKCKELKKMRAKIAEDLGVDLKQRECTYEGYCSGTCPKCKSEEIMLNMAIMKRQYDESELKKRVTVAGVSTMAALCLSGCNVDTYRTEGAAVPVTEAYTSGGAAAPEMWEGGMEFFDPKVETELEVKPETVLEPESEPLSEPKSEPLSESESEEVQLLEGDVVWIKPIDDKSSLEESAVNE